MRVLLQRVSEGSVTVDGEVVGAIGRGYVLLVGVAHGDTQAEVDRLVEKIVNLRLFPDEAGRFDRSLLDVDGEVLAISQFTLFADTRKGRRPAFTDAARPDVAEPLCAAFVETFRKAGVRKVETGRFAAHMDVHIRNDGPVTLMIDSQV